MSEQSRDGKRLKKKKPKKATHHAGIDVLMKLTLREAAQVAHWFGCELDFKITPVGERMDMALTRKAVPRG